MGGFTYTPLRTIFFVSKHNSIIYNSIKDLDSEDFDGVAVLVRRVFVEHLVL